MTQNASTIARKFAVARKTVYEWVEKGCPRNPDGSFDEDAVLAWRKATLQAAANDPNVKMAASKAALQAKRLLHQCEILELQIMQQRGKLHSKDACAASVTSICSEHLSPLLNVHAQIRAQFPELPQAVTDAIQVRIDVAFDAIRTGLEGFNK